ncbi:MAG: murein biosynthesis integral membrane protein MurJ [Pseudomonadota bacterium]|jgi:integral membrane protein MviN|nr:MAG: murein biosynthesis integral membrane protein MurJ [Pseudomonadota bacterium]
MAEPAERSEAAPARSSRIASLLVASGILLSRIVGLVRERAIATFFGAGLHADVFAAGLRMPNVLQNLLGEGTLSASFIPVYSELLGQGRTKEAGRVAGAMFALLLGIAGLISLLGILLAPVLVTVFTPGFDGERRELMITVVRILFPMTGVLVLSAWALGILNSHRRFFVPYFAPVLWNAAIIAALIAFARRTDLDGLLMAAAWGALIGGFLQFGIQLPWVLRLDREIRLNSGRNEPAFREAVRNAGPAILGRGVVQLSSYVDMVLASLLAIGAVARLRYAQTLYVLPVSLFGMSVAAAELPELARERLGAVETLRARMIEASRRVAFFVVPTLVAFVLLGDVFVAGIYRAGEFGSADVTVVWLTLAAYSLGLLASTSTRIYQSAFFALRDTKTPARVAGLRVLTSAVAGAVAMTQFEPVTVGSLRIPAGVFADVTVGGTPLGPVGLALGAAAGAWLEWALLRARLARHMGSVGAGIGSLTRMFAAALLGAAAGYGVSQTMPDLHPLLLAALVAAAFGVVYLAVAHVVGLDEAGRMVGGVLRRIRRR